MRRVGPFTWPPLNCSRRRVRGPGPCGLGLARMIAAFFRAVNRAKTVPPSPFRGDWGSFFAQISGVIFCGKCCVWGIIGGVYIQAIKIPDRAHKTLRRAAGHDRRQNGGRQEPGQEPGQDGRQISGRRRRQIGPGVAWCEPEPWAADCRRGGCGLCGRGRWGALMQAQGAAQAASRQRNSGNSNREPPAGRPDSSHRTRQGQPTTSGSRTGGQGQHQRQRPGRRSHQTRPRPHPPARNRNASARERYCWAAGQALRVRKRKIFLGKGSKNRFPGAGPGNSWGVKNATNGGE